MIVDALGVMDDRGANMLTHAEKRPTVASVNRSRESTHGR